MSALELIRVSTPEDWKQYHDIREEVLFRKKNRSYDRTHPDERAPSNVPLLLKKNGTGIGTTRLDFRPDSHTAVIRLVAITESEQRKGYGRILQQEVDSFARNEGVTKLLVNSAPEAVGFYEKIGFVKESWDPEELTGISEHSVQMSKAL